MVLGRFRIEDRIGSGGFGTVYRAWDERLQRPVAVKVIDREHGAPRVTREAQAVARLAHRNIATLYELASDGERALLVSELIEGETLRALGRRGDLNDRLVAQVGADAAAALTAAHRAGVVHRDVKPENILVVCEGGRQRDPSDSVQAKLVDFGIARIAGEKTLTATGAVVGTLAYMAPEQADGLRPGPAADVYSLALTLYECFCGEHPLLREGPAATARAIGEPIAPLGAVRPELPEAMTEAIDAALDPDPEERPLSSELGAALSAHVSRLDGDPLPPIAGIDGEAFLEPRHRPDRARFLPGAGVAALGLAALIATGAPAPVALAALLPGVLALGRPRPAYALQLALVLIWVVIGAGEPGIAALIAALGSPLLLAAIQPEAIALPGLAPLLGLAGLGPVYPALAGLTRGAAGRALLGGIGYLWLAAWEELAHRTLLLGPVADPPAHWTGSAGTALSDVVAPLVDGSVLAGAGIFALAAWALPLLIRDRAPLLDALGALVWAAGLISALRLVDGGSSPPGLLFAALLAAVLAALLTRRLGPSEPYRLGASDAYQEGGFEERGSDALA
ncbi:MAG TPA: serine/threonine-protein kinase [Solirubrobacterales bacterium]|nr:serine/threonine-protein kinase [Solirubrobacterales bacterium]